MWNNLASICGRQTLHALFCSQMQALPVYDVQLLFYCIIIILLYCANEAQLMIHVHILLFSITINYFTI